MTRVVSDILDGEVRFSSKGNTARRVFQISELAGDAGARLSNAAQASGVPRVGEAHPSVADVQVLNVTARPTNDPRVALVDVDYGVPDADDLARTFGSADVTINASLITEQTTRDVDGNFLRTTWTFTYTTVDPDDSEGRQRIRTAEATSAIHLVEVQVPTYSVQFVRRERRAPLERAKRYSGTVNQSSFLGEAADKWLCTVSSTQQDATEHRVTYAFTYNRRGWQAILTHRVGGAIPDDLTANGVQIKQVYPRANFTALGLPRL